MAESTREDGFIFWQGSRLTPRVCPPAEIQGFVDQTTASRSRSRSHCRIIFGYKVQFVFRDGFIQIADDIGTDPKASDGCALRARIVASRVAYRGALKRLRYFGEIRRIVRIKTAGTRSLLYSGIGGQ